MTRRRALSDADLERARALRARGHTNQWIASTLRVGLRTIVKRFKQPYKQPEQRA